MREIHHLSLLQVTYENTYRLDPVKKYTPDKVKLMIKEVLEDTLKGNTQ